ncbi:ATP-binding cassette domain-containing protein [Paracoccus sp. 1_MG-2023]|uniref:thiamine ABC transporter ATP-binding protein n=1 Tax=Paracoccus sp. 1_MG-2023 TaxID=3062651 RepID=UPI0020902794|nr:MULTISPECIES: ATP-binding cassette domain-containing protein [unclassified Paracoccus (in: a-proteobacteria)]MDO6669941.1 ATP-binding cassette domain-containing protein [Paracoccus sp. 1_MG-2023]
MRREGWEFTADLDLQPGGRIAVIGPSGAGKTTLLSLIAGFLAPDAGRIAWQGRDLTGIAPGKRPVSVLFQDQNLFPHLDVTRNVGLGLRPDLRLSPDQRDRVAQAIADVGLGGFGDRLPANLSGGQQSRVALARVLLRARPILLLDEPFAALGPALKSEMMELLDRIGRDTGALMLMVTHDPRDALEFARQTIVVQDGHCQPPQATGDLLRDPPPALREYLGGSIGG